MSYLAVLLIGVIGGMSLNIFVPIYFPKKSGVKESSSITKEDIQKIQKEIEDLRNSYSYNLSEAEEEFYRNYKTE